MPICPQCRNHFHFGAKDQCPECGYCLPQAEAQLGYGVVNFPRVLDAAGILSRDECVQLIQYLEKLERKIRPAALCVYITDRGQREELAMHAHWILNHAQINHKAFGRRDRRLAIEDSKMQMDLNPKHESEQADDSQHDGPDAHRKHQHSHRLLKKLTDAYYHLFYPTPPPVEKEWMLILVLDVQLARACFSWGYKLDAYVNGEELSSIIPCAYTKFRNKDILAGIKKVMSKATSQIAGNACDINNMVRREKRQQYKRQMQAALAEAKQQQYPNPLDSLASPKPTAATHQPSKTGNNNNSNNNSGTLTSILAALLLLSSTPDAHAQQGTPSPTPLPQAPASHYLGSPATEASFPTWSSRELQLQAQGSMKSSSRILLAPANAFAPAPPAPAAAEEKEETKNKKTSSSSKSKSPEPIAEETAPALPAWLKAPAYLDGSHLRDDEHLLSDLEAQDILRQLDSLNANKNYHLYLSLVDTRSGKTPEMNAAATLPHVVAIGEQALLIQYAIGRQAPIELGGQGLSLPAEELAQWQAQLNAKAAGYLHPRDAIMKANELAESLLASQAPKMRQGGVDDTLYLPKVEMGIPGVDTAKEAKSAPHPMKEQIAMQLSEYIAYIGIITSCLLCTLGYLLIRWWTRRKAQLLETIIDLRLSAPYGSGISPSVLYKEKYSKKRQLQELDEL